MKHSILALFSCVYLAGCGSEPGVDQPLRVGDAGTEVAAPPAKSDGGTPPSKDGGDAVPPLANDGGACASGIFDCQGVCDGPGVRDGSRCCPTGTCPAPTCCDGVMDGAETGVDCGGTCFAGCAANAGCTTAADCSGVADCVAGKCVLPASPVMFKLMFAEVSAFGRNPVDGTVYASIGANDATYPNSLVAFAPGVPEVSWSLAIGDTPGAIAVSDDGLTLYVATTWGVAQIDLTTRTIVRTFLVGGNQQFGKAYATAIRVVPGDARTIAVATRYRSATAFPGVHMFRDGVPYAPGATFDDWQSNPSYKFLNVTAIAFRDAQTLFTYNGFSSGFDLGTVAIAPGGLTVTHASPLVAIGYHLELEAVGGKLFASSGQVLNGQGEVQGTFGALDAMGKIAVSPDASRVYFFRRYFPSTGDEYGITCFDPRTYTRSGGFYVDRTLADPNDLMNAQQIVQWGASGLALRTWDPTKPNAVLLLPDALDRVHGCAPRSTPPMQYGCITGPDATSPDGAVRSYVLGASRLATDPKTGTLYAAVSGGDRRYPNQVVAFPPDSAGVSWSTYVGSDPGPIGVADSGKVAWVGLGGAPQIVKLDLSSHAVGTQFALPRDPHDGDVYPVESKAVPGSDHAMAAAGGFVWVDARPGALFFDDGVLRYPYKGTTDVLIAGTDVTSIAFGGPDVLYGAGNSALVALSPGAQSLTKTASFSNLIPGIGYIPIAYGAGKVFSLYGAVVDPVKGTSLGTLPVSAGGPSVMRTFVLSRDGSRYYSVYNSPGVSGSFLIKCFDTTSLQMTGSITFTTLESTLPRELALYGEDGLAMTVDDTLAILPHALATPGCEPHR